MRVIRKIISVLLLLCLLTACADHVAPQHEETPMVIGDSSGFSEDNAVVFDPQAFAGTLWDWGDVDGVALWFSVSEKGEMCMMLQSNDCWLRPNGDRFTLELRLYRTPYDESPCFVLPIGEASLVTDGTVCRLELLSKSLPTDLPTLDEQTVVYFQRSKEPAEDQMKYFHDVWTMLSLPHEQPNTDWYDEASGLRLHTDGACAVKGTLDLDRVPIACELLVGHRGSEQIFALVRENAQDVGDVLMLGSIVNSWDNPSSKTCNMPVLYHVQDADIALISLQKTAADDASELDWVGTETERILSVMKAAGWSCEAVSFYDDSFSEVYRLQKDDQTVLLIARSFVIAYARYEGRRLLSWGREKPLDHTLVDTFEEQTNHLYDVFESVGTDDYTRNAYWFLDDCRIAVAQSCYASEFLIYDPMTAD